MDKEGKLKEKAILMLDIIKTTVKQGLKVLVVGPKALKEAMIKNAAVKKEKSRHSFTFINHHHAEGRNDYQNYDIVFIFHYEPNHNEVQAQAARIFRQAELSFERELKTVFQRRGRHHTGALQRQSCRWHLRPRVRETPHAVNTPVTSA